MRWRSERSRRTRRWAPRVPSSCPWWTTRSWWRRAAHAKRRCSCSPCSLAASSRCSTNGLPVRRRGGRFGGAACASRGVHWRGAARRVLCGSTRCHAPLRSQRLHGGRRHRAIVPSRSPAFVRLRAHLVACRANPTRRSHSGPCAGRGRGAAAVCRAVRGHATHAPAGPTPRAPRHQARWVHPLVRACVAAGEGWAQVGVSCATDAHTSSSCLLPIVAGWLHHGHCPQPT